MPISTPPMPLESFLKQHFGLDGFREGQRDVIESLLAGKHTLAVMPTGRGKSLCYQLPALMLPGVTLVVSPLIALMKDQVDALQAKGVAATYINSALDAGEQQTRIAQMREGAYKLVYVAPERFRQRAFLEAIKGVDVSLFAVDEAHCLSQWGHDFRPDYLKLKAAVAAAGHPPVLAATATATPEVRADIVQQLKLEDPTVVVSGFDRPNLRYVVRYAPNEDQKMAKLVEVLEKIPGTAIVYAATRKNVENITEQLVAHGIGTVAYHAGLEDNSRAWAQNAFMSGERRVVVATNAFGMGIDKPDVRVVIHYDMPGTLEAYYQEAGRAGRDGHTSFCVLLFSPADRYLQEFFIEGGCPKPETIRAIYDVLAQRPEEEIYLSHEAINRQLPVKTHDMAVGTSLNLLERAGLIERLARGTAPAFVRLLLPDATAPRSPLQQKVLDWLRDEPDVRQGVSFEMLKLAQALMETREGVHHALVALRNKSVLDYTPPARTQGLKVVKRLIDPLVELDVAYLAVKQERETAKLDQMVGFAYALRCRRNYILGYFGEKTQDTCGRCDVCRGQVDASLMSAPTERAARGTRRAGESVEPAGLEDVAHPALFETLRSLRSKLAREADVPPFKVFPDAALKEMATHLPGSYAAFLEIKGVGKEKLARYGDDFIGAIQTFLEQNPGLAPVGVPKASMSRVVAGDSTGSDKKAKAKAQVAALYRDGLEPEAIAERCLRSVASVEGYLLELGESGEIDLTSVVPNRVRRLIEETADRVGGDRLRPIKEALPDDVSYFQIKVVLHERALAF